MTEGQNFIFTRNLSNSTDSVFIDAPSISNFEGLKNQYSKKMNKSTNELNGTRKVIPEAKNRTLPNSSKKGNIMSIEDHAAKVSPSSNRNNRLGEPIEFKNEKQDLAEK